MNCRRAVRAAALALAIGIGAGACGGDDVEGVAGAKIDQLPADLLPAQVLGLDVSLEDMSESLAGVEDSFIESVGMYGLRREELLQATLQVSTFSDKAPLDKSSFRNSLVTQISGSRAQSFRMGETTVYRTTGRKQVISVWFDDQTMFVLSVRDTFEQPRTLLREVLEVEV